MKKILITNPDQLLETIKSALLNSSSPVRRSNSRQPTRDPIINPIVEKRIPRNADGKIEKNWLDEFFANLPDKKGVVQEALDELLKSSYGKKAGIVKKTDPLIICVGKDDIGFWISRIKIVKKRVNSGNEIRYEAI